MAPQLSYWELFGDQEFRVTSEQFGGNSIQHRCNLGSPRLEASQFTMLAERISAALGSTLIELGEPIWAIQRDAWEVLLSFPKKDGSLQPSC